MIPPLSSVKAILDANRNSLMLLDLKFSILTLSITAGTFVAALYGMNLKNFIEESDLGFYGISGWCTIFGAIVAVYGLQKLRRVQRVSMYGHGPGGMVGKGVEGRGGGWGLGAWGGGKREALLAGKVEALEAAREGIVREKARRVAKAELRADEAMR